MSICLLGSSAGFTIQDIVILKNTLTVPPLSQSSDTVRKLNYKLLTDECPPSHCKNKLMFSNTITGCCPPMIKWKFVNKKKKCRKKAMLAEFQCLLLRSGSQRSYSFVNHMCKEFLQLIIRWFK